VQGAHETLTKSKKVAQKLLLCWAMGIVDDNAHGPDSQSFFATFCSQKVALPP
jgi:hypothetical protein